MSDAPLVPCDTQFDKRRRVSEAIAALAWALGVGDCDMSRDELEALARVCREMHLRGEATLIESWLQGHP